MTTLAFLQWATRQVSGSGWSYALVFAAAAADALIPIVQSETIVVLAGVLAGRGHLHVSLVGAAAAVGAFAGDNGSYVVGDRWGRRATRWLVRGDKGRARLERARRLLREHGGRLIVGARFVPGGRTATTLAAGMLELSWRRFAAADAAAACLWAAFSTLLGFFGGEAFQRSEWKPLAVSLGVAFAITAAAEVYRRAWLRRRRR